MEENSTARSPQNEDGSYNLTQEEVSQAQMQEETERLLAENQNLRNRVVLLRALSNRLQEDLDELRNDRSAESGQTTDE